MIIYIYKLNIYGNTHYFWDTYKFKDLEDVEISNPIEVDHLPDDKEFQRMVSVLENGNITFH